MQGLIELDDNLRILTRPPHERDLADLACGGARALVNLRAKGEEGEILEPTEEGQLASAEGLAYLHVPITPATLNRETATRIGEEIERLPGPVVVHCASGKRAGLMALTHWAKKHDAGPQGAADKAREIGLDYSAESFRPLLERESGQ